MSPNHRKSLRFSFRSLPFQFLLTGTISFVLAVACVRLYALAREEHAKIYGLRVAALVGLLLVFVAMLYRLYSSIIRPVEALSEVIEEYRHGDFSARIPVQGLNEIASVQGSFNQMAERIEKMLGELRELDRLKSEFVSTVSHELRTPLTSIGGYVKLLLAGDAGEVNPTQLEFLQIVDTNVDRLSALINDLLDVEKIEAGRIEIQHQSVALGDVLREVRGTLGVMAEKKGLALDLKLPEKIDCVRGDRARLVQAFLNLVSNAIKYTERGSVSIEAERNDLAVTVHIRDTGIGLSAEEQSRLFERFYRARSGLSSPEGGTGLGLAIVRGIVEAHGGRVQVESAPGKGSVFSVILPAELDAELDEDASGQEESGLPIPIREPVGGEAWVWIVHPNEAELRVLEKMLVGVRTYGRVGRLIRLRTFRAWDEMPVIAPGVAKPDAVIVDPVGLEERSLSAMLREKIHQAAPILAVSATLDPAAAIARGAQAALRKPYSTEDVLSAIGKMIGRRGWRVLIADPDTDLRILLKRTLEQRGFEVDDVDSGNRVLSRLEEEEYQLALVDLDFPDVSGIEVVRAIRRNRRFKNLPVFVMLESGRNPPPREVLMSSGADQFVGKHRGIGGVVEAVLQYVSEQRG